MNSKTEKQIDGNAGKTGKRDAAQRRKWINRGIILLILAAAALLVYFTSFRNSDRLDIRDGKIVGARPTWLVGHFADQGGTEQYRKVADVSAPKGYKEDKTAKDPDGDPLTSFFVYRPKDEKAGTAVLTVTAGPAEVPEGAEETELAGKKGWLLQEDGAATFRIPSPYPGAHIILRAENGDEDALKTLLADGAAKTEPGKKVSQLQADIKLNFIDDSRWTYLLNGLLVTLEITLLAVVLGILIGVLVAAVRSTWDQNSENMAPGLGKNLLGVGNSLCKLYLTVIRGTPVVIQLIIMYYIIFASSRNGVLIATLAFGINSGAYVAEIIRGGIMSVDRGQLEAGRSLGFNYVKTMQYIIVPQALKSVLPALANEFIVLLKETSVAGYVAVKDLTKGGDIIRGVTYSAFMPLIAVALIYLVLVMFFTWLVGKLERRLRNSEH